LSFCVTERGGQHARLFSFELPGIAYIETQLCQSRGGKSVFDRRVVAAALAVGVVALISSSAADAQAYPQKPVKVLVPAPPGSPTDLPARIVSDGLSELIGQRFVVENRPGAGGVVAGEAAARSAPDGYTLLFANSSVLAVNPALYPQMPYDTAAFTLIGFASNSPQAFLARPTLPVKHISDLLAYSAANPGKLNYASSGTGTLPHLTFELFKMKSGLNATLIPFNGGAPALTAVIAGEADFLIDLVTPRIKSGEVRAIAVTGETRHPDLPDVLTIAESGFPAVTSTSWTGLVGPAGLSPTIVAFLNAKLNEVVASANFRGKMTAVGLVPKGGTPEEFSAWAAQERERWAGVVKAAGVKPNG
jgi:tripartite-type tricarboxylate transporter receptor subunit TctC